MSCMRQYRLSNPYTLSHFKSVTQSVLKVADRYSRLPDSRYTCAKRRVCDCWQWCANANRDYIYVLVARKQFVDILVIGFFAEETCNIKVTFSFSFNMTIGIWLFFI